MSPVQKLVAYLQGLLGPINRLPSWANEALTGIFFMPILFYFFGALGLVPFETGSNIYEWWPWPKIDPNGYSAEDVGQRSIGAVAALLVMLVGEAIGIPKGWFIPAGVAIVAQAWLYARKHYPKSSP